MEIVKRLIEVKNAILVLLWLLSATALTSVFFSVCFYIAEAQCEYVDVEQG